MSKNKVISELDEKINLIIIQNDELKKIITTQQTTINKLKQSKISDGTIGEFVYNTVTQELDILGIRKDKELPNALSTAINVMNAIKNPVDLEIIKKFITTNTYMKKDIPLLMNYMTKNQLLRCIINNRKIFLNS